MKPSYWIALFLSFTCILLAACGNSGPTPQVLGHGKGVFTIGETLFESNFNNAQDWTLQIESRGKPNAERVSFGNDMLDLYMPNRGCTAWLKKPFSGPITIIYRVLCPESTLKDEGIQARDINNFWHCSDPSQADGLFNYARYNGSFGSYSKQVGYYASTGGGGKTGNRTTRFRRYPREIDGERVPHIALIDRDGDQEYLITPGKWHTVQLVAFNGLAQYIVDGKVVYEIKQGDTITVEGASAKKQRTEQTYHLTDFPAHTQGYFGIRMVASHHQYKDLAIYQLNPASDSDSPSL